MEAYLRREREQYIVRLPDGMRDRIKEEAERNHRSMNAEIVFHLEKAFFDKLEMQKGEARS